MTDQPNGLRYAPVVRATLSREQAADYLGLAVKGLQRLADRGELVPLTYTRPHRFSRVELDRFIADQVEAERQRRRIR